MLEIKEVISQNKSGNELVSKDNRRYKIIRFQEEPEMRNGKKVISNQPLRTRVVWEEGPNGSAGDSLFDQAEKGALVPGTIKTVGVEDYFIPSENGNDEHQGERGNWVNQFTTPVFDHENIFQLAYRNNRTPIDHETGEVLDRNGHPVGQSVTANRDQRITESEDENEGQPF